MTPETTWYIGNYVHILHDTPSREHKKCGRYFFLCLDVITLHDHWIATSLVNVNHTQFDIFNSISSQTDFIWKIIWNFNIFESKFLVYSSYILEQTPINLRNNSNFNDLLKKIYPKNVNNTLIICLFLKCLIK